MNKILILILALPLSGFGQTYVSDGKGSIPEMTIKLEEGYVYIKGKLGKEYKTKEIPQHAEIYFNIPKNCECGVKSGQYSGVPTEEFLELFTPYFGVLPVLESEP